MPEKTISGPRKRVPRFEDGTLGASTLILADKIESVPAAQIGLGPFVIGPYKVRPRVSREFSSVENLGLFLQVYNLQRDQAFQKLSVLVNSEQVTLNRLLPLAAFAPGSYKLQVNVQDRVSGQTISRETEFRIRP